jgi:hypothetical protein
MASFIFIVVNDTTPSVCPVGSKKKGQRLTLPFQFQEILPEAPGLEGDSGRKLNNPTGNCSAVDPSYAWIGNTRIKRRRREAVVGWHETRMVENVGSIHSNLKFALFPPGDTETLGQ